MVTKRASLFFERIDLRAHGSGTPSIEKLTSPSRRGVFPELLEVFLKEISANGFEVVLEEFSEGIAFVVSEVLWFFKEAPPRALENRLVSISSELL